MFPKFFSDRKPQILPHTYLRSKIGSKGYDNIQTTWMQLFLKEIKYHVCHHLHNLCPDKAIQMITLFNIELAQKIIPKCLRLGDIIFTHMPMFGREDKEDGQM